MDTEAIASEIVAIRKRLEEIEQSDETGAAEEERVRLTERLRFLQSRLSGRTEKADQDDPAEPGDIQYLPPA